MILHRKEDEVKRYDRYKLIIVLVLIAILIIMLLTGRAFDETAVSDSDTTPPDTTAQTGDVAEESALDLTVPVLNSPDGDLSSGDVTLSGTGEPGTEIAILVDGEQVGTTTVGSDGRWSFDTALDAGDYSITAQTLDADGNVAAESDAVSLSVADALVAPTITLPTALAAGVVALSGTGTPGSTIDIMVDGESVGTTTVGADGNWSFEADLEGGEYELTAQAVGAGGETAVSDTTSLSIAPAIVIPTITLPEGDLTAGTIDLSGSGTPGDTVEILVDGEVVGTTIVGDDGNWSFGLDLPESGDYDISAQALDADGNIFGTSDAATFTIPELAIATPTFDIPDAGFMAGLTTLSGTGEPGSDVEIVVNGEVVGTTTVGADGRWSFDYELPEGDVELAIRGLDANGVAREGVGSSASVSVAAAGGGTEAVPLTITEPADGATLKSGELVLAGTGMPGSEIEFLDNGVVIGTAVIGDDGSWQYTFEPDAGNHEYGVRVAGSDEVATIMTTIEAPVVDETAVAVCGNPEPGIDQGDTYIVGECEWLTRIANRLGISYESLIGVNPQIENPNIIYPGQVINLPPR